MKKRNCNLNNCLNSVANAMSYILLLTAFIAFIWLILVCPILKCCDIIKDDSTCIIFDLKAQITFFGGCLSLWLVCFQLKKQSDIETVKLLGYLRELLNTGEKKKIHFYLLDSKNRHAKNGNDKMALLNDLESDLKYIQNPCRNVIEEEDKIRHSNVEVFDYLGVLELGAIMLERGVITQQEFDNQFKYRIVNVYNSDLRKHIEKERKYYKYLIKHFEKLETN